MNNLYIGDIYRKVQSSSNNNEERELYEKGALIVKLDKNDKSDFITYNLDNKSMRIHSYPTEINVLFVDSSSIMLYNDKVKTKKLVR